MLTEDIWAKVTRAVADLAPVVFEDGRVDSDLLRAEGVRYLTRIIAGGILHGIEQGDAEYPTFVQPLTAKAQWGLPAVDAYYLLASVHGDHSYRIWGDRGTARLLDVEIWTNGMCGLGDFTFFAKCKDYQLGPNGTIEFVASSSDRGGNWLPLPDGPATVVMRQYFYDTETESPGMLYIEREGARYPPPPLTGAVIERRLEDFIRFVRENPAVCRKAVETYYAPDPSTVDFSPLSFGFSELQFGRGNYHCEPDQAVIIETPDPQCFYWNFQLSNPFWEALDWNIRLTSINGHEAVIDDDGVFRAVIAQRDPGVPNWLDTAGRVKGLIAARYYRANGITPPTLRTVPLAEIRDHLPAGTRQVTPEERQDALRKRMLAARRTWRE